MLNFNFNPYIYIMRRSRGKICILLILSIIVGACEDEFEYEMPPFEEKVVVDGYIEQGKIAKVVLTMNSPHNSMIDSSSYYNVVLTRAKVTISDGVNSEVLMLSRKQNKFPPHYYRSNTIRGEVGKEYKLTIIYEGDTLTASTTIPAPPEIDDAWFELNEDSDKFGFVWLKFSDDGNSKDYYRVFTENVNETAGFVATRMSVIDDEFIQGKTFELPLYKGISLATDQLAEHRYEKDDTVIVRFCRLNEECFEFWRSYTNNMLNAGNPFSTGGINLPSNINGGLGVWCGYGADYDTVYCKQ